MRAFQNAAVGVDIPTPPPIAAASTAAAMAAATTTSSPQGPLHVDDLQSECQLLGSFALIVQAALGALALLSLVYKRWREHPQRPVRVWFFDVSKQVFGSVLVHISNIFMSMLTSGRFSITDPSVGVGVAQRLLARGDDEHYVPNPCSFYLLNLAIDTTLGIPILIVLLRVFTALASLTPLGKPAESIQSGYYGNPPNAWWWLKQSFIYFAGLFGMKVCVLIIFIMMPWISRVGDWALGWTEGNEKLQVAFVMMIFPLIMNAMQYYIIDSFIKKDVVDHDMLPSDDPDEGLRIYEGRARSAAADESEDEHEPPKSKSRPRTTVDEEYDPDVDGDAPTIIGSSSSSRNTPRSGGIPTDLLPKE